jgi:hypothetical protein
MAEMNDNKIASSCQPYEDQEDSAQKQEAQSANDRLCLRGILVDPSAQQTHGEQHTICGEADEIFNQLSHKARKGVASSKRRASISHLLRIEIRINAPGGSAR